VVVDLDFQTVGEAEEFLDFLRTRVWISGAASVTSLRETSRLRVSGVLPTAQRRAPDPERRANAVVRTFSMHRTSTTRPKGVT
jgi:hypothetical protein